MSRKRFSCSTISFFWGVDKTYPDLGPHTLFLADDYRANFDSIERTICPPTRACTSTRRAAGSRYRSPGAGHADRACAGRAPGRARQQDWRLLRDEAREAVFARARLLGVTDLDQHIKFEVSYTPLSWRKRYNLVKGATHGLSHTLMQLGYLRPRNRHARYRNLYFVGASTHPVRACRRRWCRRGWWRGASRTSTRSSRCAIRAARRRR